MKIYNETPKNFIHVSEMKDGEIAIIRDWPVGENIGKIVQRNHENLVCLGEIGGWLNLFLPLNMVSYGLVEILPKGTLLEI